MSLIKCPECTKEISDKAEKCPYCGYPIKKNIEKESNAKKIKGNKNLLYLGVGIIIICFIIFIILKLLNGNDIDNKEYCNGLKWGTSLKLIEKKYPGWTYNENSNYYFEVVDSLDGYKFDEDIIDIIDMNFYFDENDGLIKIEADIIGEEIDDAILYFVNYYNKIYEQNYTPEYNTKYKWIGEKTNITMITTDIHLGITYEPTD